MTILERIYREKDNRSKMVLYSDRGLFFSLYERSAYAFHTRIKPFKVHVKTIKGLDGPFVTLGCPVSKKDDYLQGLVTDDDGQGCIVAHLDEPIDEASFLAWKKQMVKLNATAAESAQMETPLFPSVVREDPASAETDPDKSVITQCIREIKALNIASVTPMEAMLFLNGIQQRLKDVNV